MLIENSYIYGECKNERNSQNSSSLYNVVRSFCVPGCGVSFHNGNNISLTKTGLFNPLEHAIKKLNNCFVERIVITQAKRICLKPFVFLCFATVIRYIFNCEGFHSYGRYCGRVTNTGRN
jgi:hypothetical protein